MGLHVIFASLILSILFVRGQPQEDADGPNSHLQNTTSSLKADPICWKAGRVYYPNPQTICTCTGFMSAKCTKIPDKVPPSISPPPPNLVSSEPHPLDPISSDEITRSRNIIVQSPQGIECGPLVFNTISLKEPPKGELLQYFLSGTNPPQGHIARKTISIVWDTKHARVFEAVVNLDTGVLQSFVQMPESIHVPLITPDDDEIAIKAVISDARVVERCRQLGITDMSLIFMAVWPIGHIQDRPDLLALRRPYDAFMYVRNFPEDNPYAHPLPFVVVVDIATPARVVAIENLPTHADYDMGQNQDGNVVPKTPANYDYKVRGPNFLRKGDKPIASSSPEGASYKLTGNLVEWQKFKFRIGFNAREGVVLHHVTYDDNGNLRPILYRASMAEMGVIYADPRPPFQRKYGFDEGDFGLGFCLNELNSPEDCVGTLLFLNGTVNNNAGDPVVKRNAICITEEDAGVMWKHTDRNRRTFSSVRSHRLTITSIATTGNYDLMFKWTFYQSAGIQFTLGLTGLLSTNMMAVGGNPGGFGSVMAPQINAMHHQHIVGLRLDTEIDGNANSIEMVDIVPLDAPTGSPANPYGEGFTIKATPLRTQYEACTTTNPSSGRVWVVSNPSKIHPYTHQPVAWRLLPANEAMLMMKRDSPVMIPKMGFLSCNVWVTKYVEDQLLAPGLYFNNSGLPEWIVRDPGASTVNTDIVLWHIFTVAHVPRVEDYPIMPILEKSVWLEPMNFFLENPSVDVPPPRMMRRSSRNEL